MGQNVGVEHGQHSIHLLSDSLEGGLGQVVLAEVNYLSSVDWRVTLSAPSMPKYMQLNTGVAFAQASVPISIKDLLGIVVSAYTYRQKFKGSHSLKLLHAHGLRSFVITRLAFPLTPLVVTYHGSAPRTWLRRTFFRFAAKTSSGSISVAPINISGWKHWWHWNSETATSKIEPHGDAINVQARPIEVENVNKSNTSMRLGWLGRFDPPKRPDMWLASLARARESGIDIVGVMAGDGSLLEQARRQAFSLGLDVHFLGWETKDNALSQMDVLLAWSDSEGVPFVIQEAIWAGVPCLTNDLPGPTAFLGSGELGVVDTDSIIEVLKIMTEPRARSELQLKQLARLQTLLADGRAEWKFASHYQHLAAGSR